MSRKNPTRCVGSSSVARTSCFRRRTVMVARPAARRLRTHWTSPQGDQIQRLPVTSMIAILFRGVQATDVERAASSCGRLLEQAIAPIAGTRMQGPAPAPLARIKGVYRFQILLRSPHRVALRKAVESVMVGRRWAGVDVAVDVDPINIL